MKAKLNNENKARFFDLYSGQKIIECKNFRHLVTPMEAIYYDEHSNGAFANVKPLSAISDEDAMEIGFQVCEDKDDACYGMSPSGVFLDMVSFSGEDLLLISYGDFLRSRGYALPWMGLSVDELCQAGWIKLQERERRVKG